MARIAGRPSPAPRELVAGLTDRGDEADHGDEDRPLIVGERRRRDYFDRLRIDCHSVSFSMCARHVHQRIFQRDLRFHNTNLYPFRDIQ